MKQKKRNNSQFSQFIISMLPHSLSKAPNDKLATTGRSRSYHITPPIPSHHSLLPLLSQPVENFLHTSVSQSSSRRNPQTTPVLTEIDAEDATLMLSSNGWRSSIYRSRAEGRQGWLWEGQISRVGHRFRTSFVPVLLPWGHNGKLVS